MKQKSIKYSDADIASRLASKYKLNWEYFSTNIENLDPEKLFKKLFYFRRRAFRQPRTRTGHYQCIKRFGGK